jgi:hypothetical protein
MRAILGALADISHILVLGLEWVALWLERSPLHVAWPIALALAFQIALLAVHALVWWLRGTIWPIRCDYPDTTTPGRQPCKNRTLGEWHRCYRHRRVLKRRTDRHVVDPTLRRWQTKKRGARVDRDDIQGGGLVRGKSRSIGVLYYQGFARWPRDVRGLLPRLYRDYRQRLLELRAQYRQWHGGAAPAQTATTRRTGVSGATFVAQEATKLALTFLAGGLLCVAMALIARTYAPEETALRLTDEYAAALFFFFTASIIKNGVWGVRTDRVLQPRADWLDQARTETISSYVVMILLAWLAGTIGRSLGDIQDKLPSAVVLGAVLLLLLTNPKPSRRRSRRRRRAW